MRALARLVALALHVYAGVEQRLLTAFASARRSASLPAWATATTVPAVPDEGLVALLAALTPVELDALLVSDPALAAVVVAGDRGDAAVLTEGLDQQQLLRLALCCTR